MMQVSRCCTPGNVIEVRRDPPTKRYPAGDIDEICGNGAFHLERMDDSQFALMLYGEEGDVMCVLLGPKRWPKRGSPPHVQVQVSWYDEKPPAAVPAPEES